MPLIKRYSRDVNKRFFQTMGRLTKRNSKKKNTNLQTAAGYPGPETSGTGIVNHTALSDMPSAVIDDHTLYPLVDGTRPWAVGSDADGDLWYRASAEIARLAKGTAGQVLAMNSGATAPEWVDASAAPLHEQHYPLTHSDGISGGLTLQTEMNCNSSYATGYGVGDGTSAVHVGATGYDHTNHKITQDYTSFSINNKCTVIIADPFVGSWELSGTIAFWKGFRKIGNTLTLTARIKRSGSSAISDNITTLYLVASDEDGSHYTNTSKLVSAVSTSWEDLQLVVDVSSYNSQMQFALQMATSANPSATVDEISNILVHEIVVNQT